MKVLPITNNNQINSSKQQNFKAGKIVIKNPDYFAVDALTEFSKNDEVKKLAKELSKLGMDLLAEYGLSLIDTKPVIYLSRFIKNKDYVSYIDVIKSTSKKTLVSQIKDYRAIDSLSRIGRETEREIALKQQKENALKSIEEYNKSVDEEMNSNNQKGFWGKVKDFLNLQ